MVFGRDSDHRVFGSLQQAKFQFPLGIRWCSDHGSGGSGSGPSVFYFNSPWELDGVRTILLSAEISPSRQGRFQFPLGIRWCSDFFKEKGFVMVRVDFNSPWELDGVRTTSRYSANAYGN